jgi:hypothetical protein
MPWFTVSEERAAEFESRGFPVKQKSNGKLMVKCSRDDLTETERVRKGMDPDRR